MLDRLCGPAPNRVRQQDTGIPLQMQLQRIMPKFKVSRSNIRPLTISLLAALAGVPEDSINIKLPSKSTPNNDTHAVAHRDWGWFMPSMMRCSTAG